MILDYYLSCAAEQDIEDVITYLAQDNPNTAHTFIDSLYNAMGKLAANPHMGHLRKDLTDKPLKFWTFKWHYFIIYKPISPLEIVGVVSGYRDLIHLIGQYPIINRHLALTLLNRPYRYSDQRTLNPARRSISICQIYYFIVLLST